VTASRPLIGKCSACQCSVYRRGEAGKEKVRQAGKWVDHHHRKPYEITPWKPLPQVDRSQFPDPGDDEIRDWELASGAWRWT
jgi:hypothetical protein